VSRLNQRGPQGLEQDGVVLKGGPEQPRVDPAPRAFEHLGLAPEPRVRPRDEGRGAARERLADRHRPPRLQVRDELGQARQPRFALLAKAGGLLPHQLRQPG